MQLLLILHPRKIRRIIYKRPISMHMHGHKTVMSKAVHLRPGTSSRRRPRASNIANGDNGPTKRRRTNANILLSTSDYHKQAAAQQPMSQTPCCLDFNDQLVPSQNGDLLFSVAHEEGFQLNFFDDSCLSNADDLKIEANKENPLGYFAMLPTEIFHFILALLENSDLFTLANVSAGMCMVVCGYVYTPAGLKHVLPQYSEGDFAEPMEYTHLGHLLKHLTIQIPLRSRLRTASFFLNKLEITHNLICHCEGAAIAYECFGELFSAFVKGWDEKEKCKAYSLVQTTSRLEGRVHRVLCCAPSSLPTQERDIRLLHRYLFLIPARHSDKEYAFWLTQILKPWPITYQAKLLYLLTAPEDENGFVSWTEVCGCNHLQHTSGGCVDFSEVARALRVLFTYRSKEWTDDDIISIVDELTTTPNGWCLENVAQLLHKCGLDISMKVLGSWAVNGRMDKLSVLCYYLANACAAYDDVDVSRLENMRWFIAVLHHIYALLPTSQVRTQFLSNLTEKWRDYIMALYEDSIIDDESGLDVQLEFYATLTSLTKVTSALLLMSIEK